MKKIVILVSIVLFATTSVWAQRLLVDNFDQVKLHFASPTIQIDSGDYLSLSADDYVPGGQLGAPALPTKGVLLTIPFCDSIEVTVENARYDTIDLPFGVLMPLQPSRAKSGLEQPFVFDKEVYEADAYFGLPLARVVPMGTGRDRRYAQLVYSPVRVNPISGKMIVCRNAEVTVHFVGSDEGTTVKHYERYHTPAFSLAPTVNRLFTSPKDVCVSAPVRMVVLAPERLACSAINDFVDWKRIQGLRVDLIYVENGISAEAIAESLHQMYDTATYENPAPTYLLLIGDNNLMPAFGSDLSANSLLVSPDYALDGHITDLYYTTWTSGDRLPDCYQGRLSARDTVTLRNIIDKTIYYERYLFDDDSYLSRAALIAGVDNGYNSDYYDNAWRCADPSMDYIASNYINAANGFDSVLYFKNNTSRVPNGVTVSGSSRDATATTALRNAYNGGVGWVNYSAHGESNGWYRPTFYISNVNSMSNNNKPSFMIGNCCLTNQFDNPTCFGEALLRKSNRAGAVVYIGATNSTFWDEDFFWSVGIRNNLSNAMTLVYNANNRGMYDNLFHTHGEEVSAWQVTAGRMLASGNMSVQNATGRHQYAADFAEYYWEIYELMGDPTLMPWLGRAADLKGVSVNNDDGQLCVSTVPGAYVAWVTDSSHRLQDAQFADADGRACFDLTVDSLAHSFLSITAQGYKPFIFAYGSPQIGIDEAAETAVVIAPNPATDRCTVSAAGLRRVALLNVMGQTLRTLDCNADGLTLDLHGVSAGLYLLRVETATGASVRKLIVK